MRLRRILISGLVLGAGILAYAQLQKPEPRIFRPSPDSIIPAGTLSIIARCSPDATLLLDGRPLNGIRPGPGALTATIDAQAGRHELTLRDGAFFTKTSFFVRTSANASEAPDGWKIFVVHPPGALNAACTACHAVKGGEWTFGGSSLRANCFGCHKQDSFAKVHTHEPAAIPDCQMCHSPHGSTETKHLTMSRKAACEQCHPL